MKCLPHVVAAAVLAMHCAVGYSAPAQQAKYPVKPIRIIVPYAPGGGADIVARLVAQKMAETFLQAVVVDNRAGAGGRTRAVNRGPACGM